MAPGLIVFDLDGTLVDSRRDLAGAANELIVECGGAPLAEAQIGCMVGSGATVLVQRALRAAGVRAAAAGAVDRYLTLYRRRLLDHTRAYEGVDDLLESAVTLAPLAVLTNKSGAHSAAILAGLGLVQHFFHVAAGDGPHALKPAPEGLRGLMRRAGSARMSTLFVGDSAVDLETAERAGCRFCLARYGFGAHAVTPDLERRCAWIVDSPAELRRRLLG